MKKYIKQNLSKIVRFIVREAQDEIKSNRFTNNKGNDVRIKIDLSDLTKQLSSREVTGNLRNFLLWNHRLLRVLAEKNNRAAIDTYDFVDAEMSGAVFNLDQFVIIESKKDSMYELEGYILDLGVYKGGSTRSLANIFPNETIHGFDSFIGLPEDWSHVLKGSFGELKGGLPDMPQNVKLYKGWFEDTLPAWIEKNNERPISVLRVDCDIYSSTKTIFTVLKPLIKSGTWIVFDELIGYYGWREHEYKAFMEFIDETGFEFQYIAFGLTYTIVKLV